MKLNKYIAKFKKFNKSYLIFIGVLALTACVSYTTPSGKLEVGDIQYRQGYCRGSISNYFSSIEKSAKENNLPIARVAISRIKERAGNCIFGAGSSGSYGTIVYSSKHALTAMDAAIGFEGDTHDFAIWLTDFSASRITGDSAGLIDLLTKIARKNQDSILEEKATALLATGNIAKNNQNASANSASGRTFEKTHDESTQLIGSIGNALAGIGSIGGRNSAQITSLGTTMQNAAFNPNAGASVALSSAASVISLQKNAQKNCGKINSIDSAKQVCNCEGGRPEQRLKENSTHIQCTKPDIRESWGCSFFKDGLRHQCAVK